MSLKRTLFGVFGVMHQIFIRFKCQKYIIFHIKYIIVAPLCPTFLKHVDFYKAYRSEKRGVLWLASYQVCSDWCKI